MRKTVDVLFICARLPPVIIEYGERFVVYDPASQAGVLKDGRSFKIVVKDGSPLWAERLRGLKISEYKVIGSVQIAPYEIRSLQALMT